MLSVSVRAKEREREREKESRWLKKAMIIAAFIFERIWKKIQFDFILILFFWKKGVARKHHLYPSIKACVFLHKNVDLWRLFD